MSITAGNMERRLAAYAEEPKKKKTRSNPTEEIQGRAQQESRLRRPGK